MAKVTLYNRTSKKEGSITLSFRLRDGRAIQLFHKSDIEADIDDLSKFTPDGKVKSGTRMYNTELQAAISKSVSMIEAAYNKLQAETPAFSTLPHTEQQTLFDRAIEKTLNPETDLRNRDTSLLDSFKEFIRMKYADREIGPAREQKYRIVYDRLHRFLMVRNMESITPEMFTETTIREYRDFSKDEGKFILLYPSVYSDVKKRTVPTETRSENTLACEMKILKTYFTYLFDMGCIDTNPFRLVSKELRRERYDDTPFSLELKELKLIMKTDVPDFLEETRDAFLVQCALGCRIGDFAKMSMDNLLLTPEGVPYVEYIPEKTKRSMKHNRIVSPIVRYAFDIIKKRGFDFPIVRARGGQDYNSQIRALLQHCGLVREVSVTQGGERKVFKLYELASSKLCRRTRVHVGVKYQIDKYTAGLHSKGSQAIEAYDQTDKDIVTRFMLDSMAFREPLFLVSGKKTLDVMPWDTSTFDDE